MRRTRTAAVRIGRRKLADYAGRRVGLDLFIGEGETIAVANKSVAYRLASHVHNPGPVYGPSSPQRTRHPLWVDLERTWGQKIHRRIPANSSEQPAFWRSSLLAGSRSGDLSSASTRPCTGAVAKRQPIHFQPGIETPAGLREFEPDRQALRPVDE